MNEIVFDQIKYSADEFLTEFELFKPVSSNISFYGIKGVDVFVQFNNGSCWLYYCNNEIIEDFKNPPPGPDGKPLTPGKIIANKIVRKMLSQALANEMVKMAGRETALLKEDILNGKRAIQGKIHEEVYIITPFPEPGAIITMIVESMKDGSRYAVASNKLLKKAN